VCVCVCVRVKVEKTRRGWGTLEKKKCVCASGVGCALYTTGGAALDARTDALHP